MAGLSEVQVTGYYVYFVLGMHIAAHSAPECFLSWCSPRTGQPLERSDPNAGGGALTP